MSGIFLELRFENAARSSGLAGELALAVWTVPIGALATPRMWSDRVSHMTGCGLIALPGRDFAFVPGSSAVK